MTQTQLDSTNASTGTASTTGSPTATARTLTVLGFVFGVIALLFLPPLFGIAGIVCGAIGSAKGDPLGKWAIVVSAVGLVAGMVIGAMVMANS